VILLRVSCSELTDNLCFKTLFVTQSSQEESSGFDVLLTLLVNHESYPSLPQPHFFVEAKILNIIGAIAQVDRTHSPDLPFAHATQQTHNTHSKLRTRSQTPTYTRPNAPPTAYGVTHAGTHISGNAQGWR
jgi:hypothetical protein